MKWKEFSAAEGGERMLVNLHRAVLVTEGVGGTTIYFEDGRRCRVRESMNEVLAAIS